MSIMSRVLARLFKLPPPGAHKVVVEQGLQVPMRDSIVLLADCYAPHRADKQPTVLVRGRCTTDRSAARSLTTFADTGLPGALRRPQTFVLSPR
jgi:predicted acyl esterase